jgi:hypothetical protein
MRSLTVALAIAGAILFTASPVSKSNAATWQWDTKAAPAGQYSPIHPAACRGWGSHCPPGTIWRCAERRARLILHNKPMGLVSDEPVFVIGGPAGR